MNDNTVTRTGEFTETRQKRQLQYQLGLRRVEPEDLNGYNAEIANRGDVNVGTRQNLIFKPTSEELAAVRQQALEIMADHVRNARVGGYTNFAPPDGLGRDTDAAKLGKWIDDGRGQNLGSLEQIVLPSPLGGEIEPIGVYVHTEETATLGFIFNGTLGEPTPRGTLDWLRTWNQQLERALGHPVAGFGSVLCAGATAVKPAEQPPADAGTRCGVLGGGYVAVVARGTVKCAEATERLKKYVSMDRDDGTEMINSWSCVVLDGSFTGSPSIYTVSHECSSGENLIKAWPADSPLPKGYHVSVKEFTGEFAKIGYPYHFAAEGDEFTCAILPPAGEGPGTIGCHGNFPKGREETGLLLTRDAKPVFRPMRFPGYFRTEGGRPVPALRLKAGQVIAFYGVACTTANNKSVHCVNGEHELRLRPGAAELS